MADGIDVKVTGIPDLKEALSTLVPKLRVRALRVRPVLDVLPQR